MNTQAKRDEQQQAKQRINLFNPIHFCAVGFGSGMAPKMPGTFGSAMAILPWLIFANISDFYYGLILILSTLLGIYLCGKTARDMRVHDHGCIVWDEFVGMWITLWLLPAFTWYWMVIAFLLFRLFDIWKPYPISWFDKQVDGGVGIMVDDIWAGIYAAFCLWGLGELANNF